MTDVKIFSRPVNDICNYIYRPEYAVGQFTSDLKSGAYVVEGESILLVVGNAHLRLGVPGNIARQIGKLVFSIYMKRPDMAFLCVGCSPGLTRRMN